MDVSSLLSLQIMSVGSETESVGGAVSLLAGKLVVDCSGLLQVQGPPWPKIYIGENLCLFFFYRLNIKRNTSYPF